MATAPCEGGSCSGQGRSAWAVPPCLTFSGQAGATRSSVRDLEARGLQDEIMLVATGEMGRTPRINKRGGRDHWARLAPLLIYGGGVAGGQVVGASDRQGGEPHSDGFGPSHLISTILRTVLDPGKLRLQPEIPPEITRLISAPPITLA